MEASSSRNHPIAVRSIQHLGVALRRLRRQRGWTQEELGRRAGIKQASVSSVESGVPGTRAETIFKLLAALNLELTVQSRTPESP